MLSAYLLLPIAALAASTKAPVQPTIPPGFQWKLVEAFSHERCDLVRDSVKSELFEKLRPNVLAIVAFCEPKDVDPELLFAAAEREDPTGDLILVLHAKYVWKKDPAKAQPLWDKVLKLARNESLRSMAERYLAGGVEQDEALHLSAWSYQGKAKLGGGFESDPRLPLAPQPNPSHPQAYATAGLTGGVQHWQSYGSVAANYEGGYRRYSATPTLSLLDNTIDVPVSMRLGTYEDLVLHPFYGISLAGSREFGQRIGIGVMGVAYRPDYKQSVEGSVFTERLFDPLVKPEEGTHYRFDYNWDWFRGRYIYKFGALMEHVHAIDDFNNGTNFKYTHTDLGTLVSAQYLQRGVSYSLEARAKMRLDSLPSTYRSGTTSFSSRRNDFTATLRPDITLPLGALLALDVSYELSRTWSSMSGPPSPFYDYNIFDQKGELVLVTEFTNY